MYRFTGKLVPGTDIKGQLREWVTQGYAAGPAEDVPPPAAVGDWLVKGLQQKLASVKQALETQACGARGDGGWPGSASRFWTVDCGALLHVLPPSCLLPQDMKALAGAVLPILLLCLLGIAVLLASLSRKAKRD